jgi:hypothetical protein
VSATVVVDSHIRQVVVELEVLLTLVDQLLEVGQMVETSLITTKLILPGVQVDQVDISTVSEDLTVE